MQYATYSLAELKSTARELNIAPAGDRRSKQSWIDALEAHAGTTATEWAETFAPIDIDEQPLVPAPARAETTYKLVDVASFTRPSYDRAQAADPVTVQQIVDSALALGTLIAPIVVKSIGIIDYAEIFDLLHGAESLAAALELQRIDPRRFEMVGVTVVPSDAPIQSIEGQFVAVPPIQTPVEAPAPISKRQEPAKRPSVAVAASLTVATLAIARTILGGTCIIASRAILLFAYFGRYNPDLDWFGKLQAAVRPVQPPLVV
jgi:hypothetical protein